MNNPPKISIITPSFNQGRYIEQTINSIILQDYPNLEYIIIDGGSTDETIDILNKYKNQISKCISSSDKGQTHAINKGFKMCTGDICTWINSDDLIYDGALWKVAEYFSKDSNLEFIHGKGLYFNDKGNEWPADKNLNNLEIRYITHFCYDLQPSTYFRRTVFDKIGYLDQKYVLQMDAEFFMRIGLNCNIMKVGDMLSKFREHDLRKSKSLENINFVEIEFYLRYSKLLRSFSFTEDLIDVARNFNIYIEGNDVYPVSKTFCREQIDHSFFIFLVKVAEVKYIKSDYNSVKIIINYMREHYPIMFKQDKTILSIFRRISFVKFIPSKLMIRLRSTTIRNALS